MKVVKIMTSTFLAIIVIPIIMAFIVYLSASSIISKKSVDHIIKKINVSNFLVNEHGEYNELGRDIKDELVKNGIPSSVVDEFIDSEEITDFFSDYAGKVVDYIVYDKEIEQPTAQDISKLINDNVDSIVNDLRKRKVEGYEELTDENINKFKEHVDEVSKEVEKNLPDFKESIDDSNAKEAIKIVRFVFGSVALTILISIISVLLLLILLLNLKRYNYLVWIGIIFILSSVPFVALSNLVPMLSTDIDSKAVIDIIGFVFGKINLYSVIFLISGIVCVTLAIVLKTISNANNVEEAGI